METFWALLKRGYMGVYHWWSPKHLQRYVNEFCGRYNTRDESTMERISAVFARMRGTRLMYRDLEALELQEWSVTPLLGCH